jgi:long-chain fatty acid transport protein
MTTAQKKNVMSKSYLSCVLSALALGCTSISYGLGLRIPDQDAFAAARGNAFAATADNPSAIYYNPAGISQLDGMNVRIGVDALALYDHQHNAKGAAHTVDSVQPVPQLYFTAAIPNTSLTFGLGVYSPFGLALEWPHNSPTVFSGQKGSLRYITFNPVISWQATPKFSIAAGPTLNNASTDIRQAVTTSSSEVRFKGSDNAGGYTAGMLWKMTPQVNIGATYRSKTTMNFRGPVGVTGAGPVFPNAQNGAEARFIFPQNILMGISYRPTTNWNLEFDADYTDWNQARDVSVSKSPLKLFGTTPKSLPPLPFNYTSSFLFEWGATHYFGQGWQGSAGYIYSQNSVPDTSFGPLIPDSDRHIWSLGVGKRCGHFSWDVTYQLAWGPPRTVSGSPAPSAGNSADGTYEFLSHAFLISAGYHF